jgi:hypothetical protein
MRYCGCNLKWKPDICKRKGISKKEQQETIFYLILIMIKRTLIAKSIKNKSLSIHWAHPQTFIENNGKLKAKALSFDFLL